MTDRNHIVFSADPDNALSAEIDRLSPDRIMVVTDSNTRNLCLPLLRNFENQAITEIPAGEAYKTADTLTGLWHTMADAGLTRRSAVVCLGGGVVCDVAGMAAATFKRGVRRINIPTTLLAAVDASVGGKTAIDFCGVKNMIGVFSEPDAVIISAAFHGTLPRRELLSGHGEMLKHGLLSGAPLLIRTLDAGLAPGTDLIRESVELKARVVASDPFDTGYRHILNLGHTAGHAIEALANSRGTDCSHGAAVAHGLGVALVLSRMLCGLDSGIMYRVTGHIASLFGPPPVSCDDYPELLRLMGADKKNMPAAGTDTYSFVLLEDAGRPLESVAVSRSDVESALDIYRDLNP